PFLALWGAKYLPFARSFADFIVDAGSGALPAVSFVEPRFLGEEIGASNDDHPHADIRNGQAFMHQVYTAVTNGPAWSRTLLVINYDEWGGFFDHVPPPTAVDGLLGFRTPCFLISPYAPRAAVSHLVFDHTSVL